MEAVRAGLQGEGMIVRDYTKAQSTILFNNAAVVTGPGHPGLAQMASTAPLFKAACIPEVPDLGEAMRLIWLAVRVTTWVPNRTIHTPSSLFRSSWELRLKQ